MTDQIVLDPAAITDELQSASFEEDKISLFFRGRPFPLQFVSFYNCLDPLDRDLQARREFCMLKMNGTLTTAVGRWLDRVTAHERVALFRLVQV